MDHLYFAKTRKNATIPTKRAEDGWYDIYPCFEEDEIEIEAFSIKLIPTGIASSFDMKYRISLGERGSNTKSKLMLMAGKIDSGYRGEWFVALYNNTNVPIIIKKNIDLVMYDCDKILVPYSKAICQAGVEFVPQVQTFEISYEELLQSKSERGVGKLGSSNK